MKSVPDPAFDLQVNSMPIEIDGTRSLLIVALSRASLVATLELFCHVRPGAAAEVQNFFVRPDHRKKGIGRKLLELAADLARSEGCTSIALAVNKSNESAVEFYRRNGFTILEKPLTTSP